MHNSKHLQAYLNDHLAGAVAAVEILDALESAEGHREWVGRLRAEIMADREELERLMQTVHVKPSRVRQASAWAAEKVLTLKGRLDDRGDGRLHVFQLLETLALGINGKRALWSALEKIAAHEPDLRTLDYPRLIERAIRQRDEVEMHRIAAAQDALPLTRHSQLPKERPSTRNLVAFTIGLATAAAVIAQVARRSRRFDFAGRSVVITGGSRGLGLLVARELAAEGARLTIAARDPDELAVASMDLEGYGADVDIFVCDIGVPSEAESLIDHVVAHTGRIDVLINNAGIITVGPVEHMTSEDFEQAMAVHFRGPLHTMLAAIPYMRQHGEGRIVNVSSIGGKIGVPHLAPYCASKFALAGLSDSMRAELAKDHIYVTTVFPGLMRTGSPFNAFFKGRHREEFAWFTLSDSLPGASIEGRRAAVQLIEACRHGDAELVIGWPAKLAVLSQALMPGVVTRAAVIANQVLLPSATDDAGTEAHSGWDSASPSAPSRLTTLTNQAAFDNNEV